MTQINWLIQFMETPTGVIVYADSKVHPEHIEEYGAENTTGILRTSVSPCKIEQVDIPELQQMAEQAAAIGDSRERHKAWKEVERCAESFK